MRLTLFIICLITATGCKRESARINTARKFVDCIRNDQLQDAANLVDVGISKTAEIQEQVKRAKYHYNQHGTRPEKDWWIEYHIDRAPRFVYINIPYYNMERRGNKATMYHCLQLWFDYTNNFVPASKVASLNADAFVFVDDTAKREFIR